MYKIFIHNKPLLLLDSSEEEPDWYPFELKSGEDLSRLFLAMSDERLQGAFIKATSPNLVLQEIKHHCQFLQAAGGLISRKKSLFFIHRRGSWDLPKGKLDPGEEIRETAIREIEEETGLTALKMINYAGDTLHIYADKFNENRLTLKRTFWYNYELKKKQKIKLEREEGIENYKWVDELMLPSVLKDAYASIAEIVNNNRLIHFSKD